MTRWRHFPFVLAGLLALIGPAVTPALPAVAPLPGENDDEVGLTEVTFAVDASQSARRPTERHRPVTLRSSAVVSPHRHHAPLAHAQGAPISYRRAVNPPLHC